MTPSAFHWLQSLEDCQTGGQHIVAGECWVLHLIKRRMWGSLVTSQLTSSALITRYVLALDWALADTAACELLADTSDTADTTDTTEPADTVNHTDTADTVDTTDPADTTLLTLHTLQTLLTLQTQQTQLTCISLYCIIGYSITFYGRISVITWKRIILAVSSTASTVPHVIN